MIYTTGWLVNVAPSASCVNFVSSLLEYWHILDFHVLDYSLLRHASIDSFLSFSPARNLFRFLLDQLRSLVARCLIFVVFLQPEAQLPRIPLEWTETHFCQFGSSIPIQSGIIFHCNPIPNWISLSCFKFNIRANKIYSLVVALLADGLEVDLVELGLDRHLLVAGGAGKVIDAPRLVQRREDVAPDDLKGLSII